MGVYVQVGFYESCGRWCLDLIDASESTYAQFDARGLLGGGYTWEGVVRALVEIHLPGALSRLDAGAEADNMHAYADSRELLEQVAELVRRADRDPALLAAAMVEWMEDLERRVTTRAPRGDTTSERVYDVLRRAVATMEKQPKLAEAVITALTSDDREAGGASTATTDVMQRVMLRAFPDDADPETEAAIAKVLGHVWFSCLVAWSNGVGDLTWVS